MNHVHFDNNSQIQWLKNVPITTDPLYVLDWFSENNLFYVIGINPNNLQYEKLKIKNIIPGLYVWAVDEFKMRNLLINVLPANTVIEKIENSKYYSNTVNVFDCILNSNRYDKNWQLFKIETTSFLESKNLYNVISNNQSLSYHITTLGQWTLSTFIMMEMHVQKKSYIYCVGIDENMNYVSMDNVIQKIPTVVFDIETVSNYDHRIPMGNYICDHIMSITIIVGTELYTIFNIPVNSESDMEYIKNKIENVEFSNYYKIKNRNIFIENSEINLLCRVFDIFEKISTPYLCLGYNSRGYDMPFLLNRCVYLNLMDHVNKFYFINGILSYGKNMIHLDVNQIIVKFFAQELTSFTLKNVALNLLEDENTQKLDFNARNLRYIYKYMNDFNTTNYGNFNSVMCGQNHVKWEVDIGTLAKYNEMDCLVVLALWDKLRYDVFITYASKHFFLPFIRITLSKLSEYQSGNMIFVGLQKETVFGHHFTHQTVKNKEIMLYMNVDNIASSQNDSSYGGGFNFRIGKQVFPIVHAMDAQAYYPELISGLNLSHETTSLITVGDFLLLNKHTSFDENDYSFFKFCTHKSLFSKFASNTKSLERIEQGITPYGYINKFSNNCEALTLEKIKTMSTKEKIVVINNNKKGILSDIIQTRNSLRNTAKTNKKLLNVHLEMIQNMIIKYNLGEIEKDDDDFADSDEEDENIDFNIENYIIKNKMNIPEEQFLVSIQLELIGNEVFSKCKNPVEAIDVYSKYLSAEFVRLNSHYRNMKLLNNSIYGLLGSSYGTLKSKNIAAIVTMFGRKFIIEAAKIGNSINGSTIYSDTDSVYFDFSKSIVQKPHLHVIREVNKLNKNVILNFKIYKDVFIIGRKTYIATSGDSIFSRGINKNGPELWKTIMNQFYTRFIVQGESITEDDVHDVLYNMYDYTFKEVEKNKQQVLRTMTIQDRNAYKKELPITKLMTRIKKQYPTFVFGNKISYFYKTMVGDIGNIYFALDFELQETNIEDINIYKFYSGILNSYYSIISYAIENQAFEKHGIVIKYSNVTFKKVNKLAYINLLDKIKADKINKVDINPSDLFKHLYHQNV